MSQWGQEKVVNGARFAPLVASAPFAKATPASIIDSVLTLDNGGDSESAKIAERELLRRFVGAKNEEWGLMSGETEIWVRDAEVASGKFRVIETLAILRENHSGERQIQAKRLEFVRVEAEGEWLTESMAAELVSYLLTGGAAPGWIGDA